ncbi:hypothetical protein BC835DRAFT_394809 [Cytidiella melzeri]|nr:hypothetical protein BC835DRAFT_394809 [Cytidiella melzeri]
MSFIADCCALHTCNTITPSTGPSYPRDLHSHLSYQDYVIQITAVSAAQEHTPIRWRTARCSLSRQRPLFSAHFNKAQAAMSNAVSSSPALTASLLAAIDATNSVCQRGGSMIHSLTSNLRRCVNWVVVHDSPMRCGFGAGLQLLQGISK